MSVRSFFLGEKPFKCKNCDKVCKCVLLSYQHSLIAVVFFGRLFLGVCTTSKFEEARNDPSRNSSLRLQHMLEVVFAAIEFEEAHLDSSEEEWKEWKEWYYRGSATYLYCQLCHLSVQHLQARAVRHQRFQQAHQSVQLESNEQSSLASSSSPSSLEW